MQVINVIPSDHSTPVFIDDLISPESAQNGFYVASGTSHLAGTILEKVVDLFYQESQATSISAGSKMGRLFWIDAGNSFNAYRASQRAAQKGLDPRRVLRAIHVARPFTAFQFQQMLEKVPRAVVSMSSPLTHWTPLVIISDLMGLFYDVEIQERDVHRAFDHFIQGLSDLRKRAVVLALNVSNYDVPVSRRNFLPRLLSMAQPIFIPKQVFSSSPVPLALAANDGW